MSQKIWWDSEGSAMHPLPNEDMEEFANRITQIAWSNAAYVVREACAKVVIDNNHMFATFQAAESLASEIRAMGDTE
jgi:hypothetical protein